MIKEQLPHPSTRDTNIHQAKGDNVAYQQRPSKNATSFSKPPVSAGSSRSNSRDNTREMGAYHLPASIGRIRRLELLVDAGGDDIHCEWKVRMQIALQGIMQVFKFFHTAIDLCHFANRAGQGPSTPRSAHPQQVYRITKCAPTSSALSTLPSLPSVRSPPPHGRSTRSWSRPDCQLTVATSRCVRRTWLFSSILSIHLLLTRLLSAEHWHERLNPPEWAGPRSITTRIGS
jgi:hypothetical protein